MRALRGRAAVAAVGVVARLGGIATARDLFAVGQAAVVRVFVVGIGLAWVDAPRWLSAVAYLAVGWVGVIAVPQVFAAGVAMGVLLAVGGALYTVGALTYASTWPNPFPATFGFHEVFHVLVVAAAITQFVAVSLLVM